tara:strand:- start:2183 stop:2512 length:330 start_codon:yes stop_codon:yes gene_type:complete
MNRFNNTHPVNSIEEFETQLVNQLNEYYKDYSLGTPKVQINKGNKFYKIIVGTGVWGFVARIPFIHKGVQLMKGDLMKPAGWSAAAKHARGNVIEGSAAYGVFGPLYLK